MADLQAAYKGLGPSICLQQGSFKFQLIFTRDLGVKGVTAPEQNQVATLSID